MQLSFMLMGQIMAMVLIALIGFVSAKRGLINEEESRVISRMVVYVVTPCALIASFQTEFHIQKLEALAVTCGAAILIHGLLFGLSRLFSRGAYGITRAEQGAVIYSNAGNLIIPIILGTLGSEYVIYSSSYMTVQSLLVWTHGQALMGGEAKLNVKRVATNPCILSILIGLTLFFLRIRLPDAVGTGIRSLGNCIGPLSMLVIGVLLAQIDLRGAFSSLRIYWIAAIRLLICPVLSMGILLVVERAWGRADSGAVLTVILLCAAAPTATTITQLAQMYHSPDSRYLSSINAVTTILCVVTMPLMVFLFQLL